MANSNIVLCSADPWEHWVRPWEGF